MERDLRKRAYSPSDTCTTATAGRGAGGSSAAAPVTTSRSSTPSTLASIRMVDLRTYSSGSSSTSRCRAPGKTAHPSATVRFIPPQKSLASSASSKPSTRTSRSRL